MNVDPRADRATSITPAERREERGTTDEYSYILWVECLLLKADLSPHCSPEGGRERERERKSGRRRRQSRTDDKLSGL